MAVAVPVARRTRRRSGSVRCAFTLIELLVVVAVIGILVAVAMLNFKSARIKAMVGRVQGDLHSLKLAAVQYRMDNGYYMKTPCRGASHSEPCLFNVLSSPICYISASEAVDDPFQKGGYMKYRRNTSADDPDHTIIDQDRRDGERYGWYEVSGKYAMATRIFNRSRPEWKFFRGSPVPGSFEFILVSRGPDLVMNIDDVPEKGFPSQFIDVFLVYDPSNGISSFGDIFDMGP